jgi:hypothetical protein
MKGQKTIFSFFLIILISLSSGSELLKAANKTFFSLQTKISENPAGLSAFFSRADVFYYVDGIQRSIQFRWSVRMMFIAIITMPVLAIILALAYSFLYVYARLLISIFRVMSSIGSRSPPVFP